MNFFSGRTTGSQLAIIRAALVAVDELEQFTRHAARLGFASTELPGVLEDTRGLLSQWAIGLAAGHLTPRQVRPLLIDTVHQLRRINSERAAGAAEARRRFGGRP